MHPFNTEIFYQEVGLRIRDARNKAGMTQETLATELDLSRVSIMNLEKGRHRPSLHLIVQIASLLMVSPSSLIPDPQTEIRQVKKSTSFKLSDVISDQPKFDKSTKASLSKFMDDIFNY